MERKEKKELPSSKEGVTIKGENVRSNKKRNIRTSLHKQKHIGIKQEPGYHYHVFNDEKDAITCAQKAGYELIEKDSYARGDAADSSQMGRYASLNVGNGVKAFYMRIRQDWYDADQVDKQKENDAIMGSIGSLKGVTKEDTYGEVTLQHNVGGRNPGK